MSALEQIAEAMRATANEITDWSASELNRGPWEQEIHRTNVQLGGALVVLAERLEAIAQGSGT